MPAAGRGATGTEAERRHALSPVVRLFCNRRLRLSGNTRPRYGRRAEPQAALHHSSLCMRSAGEPFFGCGIRYVSLGGAQTMSLRRALFAATMLAVPAAASAQPVTGLYIGAGAGANFINNPEKWDLSGSAAPGNFGLPNNVIITNAGKANFKTGWT